MRGIFCELLASNCDCYDGCGDEASRCLAGMFDKRGARWCAYRRVPARKDVGDLLRPRIEAVKDDANDDS